MAHPTAGMPRPPQDGQPEQPVATWPSSSICVRVTSARRSTMPQPTTMSSRRVRATTSGRTGAQACCTLCRAESVSVRPVRRRRAISCRPHPRDSAAAFRHEIRSQHSRRRRQDLTQPSLPAPMGRDVGCGAGSSEDLQVRKRKVNLRRILADECNRQPWPAPTLQPLTCTVSKWSRLGSNQRPSACEAEAKSEARRSCWSSWTD